jgi:hypothetical protein
MAVYQLYSTGVLFLPRHVACGVILPQLFHVHLCYWAMHNTCSCFVTSLNLPSLAEIKIQTKISCNPLCASKNQGQHCH